MTAKADGNTGILNGLPQDQISRAIGLARISLIIGLVFLHYGSFPNTKDDNPFTGFDLHEHSFVTWLNSTVLFFFFACVPLLSMVSGWLFFSFTEANAWPQIKRRVRRRFVSLYLPLVVWNLANLILLYSIARTSPAIAAHLNWLNIHFDTAGPMDYVNAVFGITKSPIAFQFWFVRDLFVTSLTAPLMWIVMRRTPWLGAAALGVAWICGFTLLIFLRLDVPFFFYLGALIRQKQIPITMPLRVALSAFGLYVVLAGLRALAPLVPGADADPAPQWLDMATHAMRLVGVVGCWGLIYRLAESKPGRAAAKLGGLAFFLHSMHWPLLVLVKKAVWVGMPGQSGFWMLVHYGVSVAITVSIGLGTGLGLAKFLPRIFSLMNGGRLLEQTAPHVVVTSVPSSSGMDVPPQVP